MVKGLDMIRYRGSTIDRRCLRDRRQVHNMDYFLMGGAERRDFRERRAQVERRKHWIRANNWMSVFVGDLKMKSCLI